jgi:hypothetical protein
LRKTLPNLHCSHPGAPYLIRIPPPICPERKLRRWPECNWSCGIRRARLRTRQRMRASRDAGCCFHC